MAVGKFLDAETKEIAGLTKKLGDLEGLLNQSQGDLALLLGSSLPPPAGTVADIASLGVSVSRGDWGGAFLDVIGLVPLVGDGVKGLVKGTKIGNKIDNIRKAIAHGKKNLADKVAKAKKNAEKRCKKLTGNKKKKNKDKDAATDCGTNCGAGKKNTGGVNGGAHRQTTKPVGDGKDSHHMPDRNADPNVHANDGPAIKMDPKDHAATSSNGRNGLEGKKYRAETAEMIKDGQYRDAMAREVKDVRRAAQQVSGDRTKYNTNTQEMLDYARKSGQLPPK